MTLPNPLPQLAPFISQKQVAVTPNDTTVINFAALYIGVAGDVTIMPYDSTTPVLFKSHPAGYFPNAGARVMAAGTAATNIVALN